jgi:WD40 repeat protein
MKGMTMFKGMMKVLLVTMCFVGMVNMASAAGKNDEPASEVKAKIFVQLGHTSGVRSVAVSPDGRTLISGSDDHTLKLWDVASGREMRTFKGHDDYVRSVAFSPDGHTIASGGDDKTIKLWDVASGRVLRTLSGDGDAVYSVAFSPDGRTLACGSKGQPLTRNGNLKLWDVATGRELRTLNGHKGYVSSVVFSSDGRTLASGSWDKTIKLWDLASGRELRTFAGHVDSVYSIAYSTDGHTLASGSDDKTIKLWDVASGQALRTFTGHGDTVYSLSFSADGRTLASGSRDKTIKLWNIASGIELRTLSGHEHWVNSVAFLPDGKTIVSASADNKLMLWDVASKKMLRSLTGRSEAVFSAVISPDGRTLASGGWDKSIALWDIASGQMLRKLNSGKVLSVIFSPDGHTLISGGDDKTIKLWDVASGKLLRTFTGHGGYVYSVVISPDGRTLASGSEDKTIKLWDIAKGSVLSTLMGHAKTVASVTFSSDGRTLASASWDDTIKLWDVANGRELSTLKGHGNSVNAVAFSPDGRILASGSRDDRDIKEFSLKLDHLSLPSGYYDHTLRLWDVASGRELRTIDEAIGTVNSVVFSPDGHTLVSSNEDGTIKLWDMTSGKKIMTLTGHDGRVKKVVFTQNAQELYSAGADGTVRRWNALTGAEIAKHASFTDGEWISIIPEGYYTSSEKGSDNLNVRIGDKVQGINQFYDVFFRPDIVEAKLRGEDTSGLITLTIDDAIKLPPPEIAFTAVPSTSTANAEKVCYKAVATGGGIGEVRLFQNGKLIKSDGFYRESVAKADTSIKLAAVDGATVSRALKLTKTSKKSETPMVSNSKGNEYTECQEFETIPGDNEISVAAFNANNTIQSRLETINFKSSRKPEDPHLYVLGIGIDKYNAAENNLAYAVKDATDFRGMIKEKAKGLFNASNIHIEGLSDVAASKVGIQQAITAISAKVKPWDSFILFVASHGYLQENQYYIVTSDFDGTIDTSKMISSNEIVGMSKNIKSLSQLLIFDTCHAGGVDNIIGGLYDARMSVMAKKMGLHIYASAGGTQTALDGYQGNGLFTHALLDSMKADTTDTNHDSEVSVAELGESARQETINISKQLGFPQSPNIINFGKDNPLFRVK